VRRLRPPPGVPDLPQVAAGAQARTRPEPQKLWEVTNIPAGRGAEGFDVSPDGRQIWSANAQDGTITVIDVPDKKALETFPVPVQGANRLKFSLDGRYVLVSGLGGFGPEQHSNGNDLVVLDAASHQLIKAFQLGGGSAGILMEPSGSRAYVAVNRGGKVVVVDLHTMQVSGQIPADQPDGMAWAQAPAQPAAAHP
jgi:DNA-binding beta-propeller fold protein YncE